VLLTFVGGLLGLAVGAWGIRLLEILGADRLPLGAHIAFDGCLASIGLAGAVVLGIVIAVPIAWFNLSTHLAHALQSESRTGTISRTAQRLRHGFIVAQRAVTPNGYVPAEGESLHGHYSYQVTGDYFTTLGIPLREGRFLTSADSHRADLVCVVDEDFARRYWPKGAALGQRVFQGSDSDEAKLFTIVGVVGAVKQAELTEPQGQGAVYLPFLEVYVGNIFVVTRTSQRPEAFAETLRKLVRAANPALAIDNLRFMDTRIDEAEVIDRQVRIGRAHQFSQRLSKRFRAIDNLRSMDTRIADSLIARRS